MALFAEPDPLAGDGADSRAVNRDAGTAPAPSLVANRKTQLSKRAAIGLDAARALAAIYVVLHHVILQKVAISRALPQILKIPFKLGQEAVIVFFLLSGFVIFANENARALRPKGYYLRRLRRIYPVLLIAMLVSTLVALSNHQLSALFSVQELFGTLAGLQDVSFLKPGVIADPYLRNDP